jgi:peptidoglycan/xylan/chitin deacetylase (PgdA/CDA1 family)
MKIKNKTMYILITIVILILALILILFFSTKKIFVKEFKSNIYINTEGKEANNAEEKVLEELVRPKNLDFIIPIFMYHFITDEHADTSDSENFMPPAKLEMQLKYIVDNGYETVYITELDKLYKYKKPVALTFDDCFIYFYKNAFPLLKKYNLKASIYVITDYINGENYLTTDQIKEMKESGIIDIQSHTLTHPKLTNIPSEQLQKEVIDSKAVLKELFDINSSVFCYPYGIRNNAVVDLVQKHYLLALDMDGGLYYSNKYNVYKIPRIYANRSMTMTTFINYLKQSKVNANW